MKSDMKSIDVVYESDADVGVNIVTRQSIVFWHVKEPVRTGTISAAVQDTLYKYSIDWNNGVLNRADGLDL